MRVSHSPAQPGLPRSSETVLSQVLGVLYPAISSHLLAKAGLTRATGNTGAVTLIQRLGSALNLNAHFHMILSKGYI